MVQLAVTVTCRRILKPAPKLRASHAMMMIAPATLLDRHDHDRILVADSRLDQRLLSLRPRAFILHVFE
jgi:hypothetical protein